MSTIIRTSSKPPVAPAAPTGDQYIDRYNKRFLNPVTSLTETEREEARSLHARLLTRATDTYGPDYGKDMRILFVYPFDAYDLDALRTYDRMFDHGDPYDVRTCIVLLRRLGEASVADALTPGLLSDLVAIKNAMKEHREAHESEYGYSEFDRRQRELKGIAVLNPGKAPAIASIIADRGITDPDKIITILEEMESAANSLVRGVL